MRALGPLRTSLPSTVLGLTVAGTLVGALAGCGGGDDTASEPVTPPSTTSSTSAPASTPTSTPTSSPASSPASTTVAIVSQTAAGGEVSPDAVPLPDPAAVQSFGDQFETPQLGAEVRRAAERTDVPAGSALYAAVVAIGCDVPVEVVVSGAADEVVVEAAPAKQSSIQCLAPVTSVALVLVPDA